MKNFFNFLILFLVIIFQTTILKNFSIYGITFNLALIIVFLWSIFFEEGSLFWIVFLGLLVDFASANYFGLYSLGLVIIFLFSLLFKKFIGEISLPSAILLIIFSTLVFDSIYLFGLRLQGLLIPISQYFSKLVLGEIVYNSLLTLPLYFLFKKYSDLFLKDRIPST